MLEIKSHLLEYFGCYRRILIFCPSWSCATIYYIFTFTPLCKIFTYMSVQQNLLTPCAPLSLLGSPGSINIIRKNHCIYCRNRNKKWITVKHWRGSAIFNHVYVCAFSWLLKASVVLKFFLCYLLNFLSVSMIILEIPSVSLKLSPLFTRPYPIFVIYIRQYFSSSMYSLHT